MHNSQFNLIQQHTKWMHLGSQPALVQQDQPHILTLYNFLTATSYMQPIATQHVEAAICLNGLQHDMDVPAQLANTTCSCWCASYYFPLPPNCRVQLLPLRSSLSQTIPLLQYLANPKLSILQPLAGSQPSSYYQYTVRSPIQNAIILFYHPTKTTLTIITTIY